MNIAVIIAGGVGARTMQHIPKQFINVLDKPIIIYTLEKFQRSSYIDAIEVVCLEGWHDVLKAYAVQFGIAKLKWIVTGGSSSQESIYNGLKNLSSICSKDDIVIIHDGIRPMVDDSIIISCINTCQEFGNGISSLPIYEQIFKTSDSKTTQEYIPRENLRVLQTPQAYKYNCIMDAYEKAFKENVGIHSSAYANTLMTELGNTLYFSEGSTKNIKITTKDDIAIFKSIILSEKGE